MAAGTGKHKANVRAYGHRTRKKSGTLRRKPYRKPLSWDVWRLTKRRR